MRVDLDRYLIASQDITPLTLRAVNVLQLCDDACQDGVGCGRRKEGGGGGGGGGELVEHFRLDVDISGRSG